MMPRGRLLWLPTSVPWVCLAIGVAEGLGACRSTPSPARFPHDVHLAKLACGAPGQPACLSCRSCHSASERAGEQGMPAPSVCRSCHANEPRHAEAVLAFAPERPSGEIRIDHDRHLALDAIRGQCVPCHAGVVERDRPAMPPMSQCFTCHEHSSQWERGECAPCHDPRDLARTLPVTFLRHDAAFMRQHGKSMAQSPDAQLCQSCHTQSQCQACHDVTQGLMVEVRRPERIDARQVHRGDFMVRHALEASSEPARCLSCHAPETCDGCHVARGVSGNRMDARNPHPLGWLGSDTRSRDFHGVAARRDILSCASCHDAGPATNCIRCHKVGAYGGNPHPHGWRSARDTGAQMCRYCHE